MKCPACLEFLVNHDEVHHIDERKQRMNLHCWNSNCITRTERKRTQYGTYMQVIINSPDPWVCNSYGLIIPVSASFVLLEGWRDRDLSQCSFLMGINKWRLLKKSKFVDISTGDDMHLQALDAMKQMTKLLAFA